MTVTDSAKEELKRLVGVSSLDPGKYLKLAVPPVWTGQGDFGVVIDKKGNADQAVEFQGTTVLLVDAAMEERLSKAVLDFKASPDGPRFTLDVY